MRIIHAEDPHALVDPELEDAAQFLPQGFPIRGFKIDGIDVLIFLRRILGVLNRTIGSNLEPVLVLANVGMVRRTLKGDIQSYVKVAFARLRDEVAKIL